MLLCFSILNTICVTFCLSQRGCDCHCGIRLFTAAVHALRPRLVAVLVATTTPIKELLAGTSIQAVVETLEGSAAGSRIGLLQAILCRDEKPQSDRFFNFPMKNGCVMVLVSIQVPRYSIDTSVATFFAEGSTVTVGGQRRKSSQTPNRRMDLSTATSTER